MKLTILLTVFFLAGCINIYGPNKTEGQENKAAQPGDTGTSGGTGSTTVMNRKPAELLTDIGQYYQSQGITPQLEDVGSGIVAATGDDPALAREWLDCGTFQNSLNIIPHYRLVTQVWSAGEGSHITSLVTELRVSLHLTGMIR